MLLKVDVRYALHILGLLLTIHLHLVGWDVKRVLLLVELRIGVIEIKLEIVKLIPQEVTLGVALANSGL